MGETTVRATHIEAVSEACNNTCDDHLSVAEGRCLQYRPNDHDDTTENDRLLPSQTVTNP